MAYEWRAVVLEDIQNITITLTTVAEKPRHKKV